MAGEVAAGVNKVKVETQGVKTISTAVKKYKPTHPPTSEMVTNAVKALKERGGSSLPAIKKYLSGNYKVNIDKLAPFIRKYLKSAVASGILIQTKGKGASGSFKLSKLISNSKQKVKSAEAKQKKSVAKKVIKKPARAIGKSKKKSSVKKMEKKKAVNVAKSAKKSGGLKSKISKQKLTKTRKTAKSLKAIKVKTSTAKKSATKKTVK